MTRLNRIVVSFGNGVEFVFNVVVFVLVLSSILLFSYLVLMRYMFGRCYDWGDHLVQAMIISGAVLAAAGASRHDEHTVVDLLTTKAKGRKHDVLLLAQYFITLVTCGIMVWAGLDIVSTLKLRGLASTSSIPTPIWLLYAMLPIALFFSSFYYLEKILQKIGQLRSRGKDYGL